MLVISVFVLSEPVKQKIEDEQITETDDTHNETDEKPEESADTEVGRNNNLLQPVST
jgi:hypothetical protein